MYSINGIRLHDSSRGWRILRSGTNIQGGIINTLNKVQRPQRPGYIPGPKTFTEQTIIFNMRVTRAGMEPLMALAAAASVLTRDDDPTKYMNVELSSAIPAEGDTPFDTNFDLTITLSGYEGVWRDTTAVDFGPTTITTTPQTLTLLTDMSAPVQDALVFIGGVFGQFVLKDSRGSWLKTMKAWPGGSTFGILYNGSTGQAAKAMTADPFTPVSDASQYVDVSGNGGFKLTPMMVSGNPANRQVQLSLTTSTQSGVTLRVRAKRAYRMN